MKAFSIILAGLLVSASGYCQILQPDSTTREEFIDIYREPQPLQDIYDLVVYPEAALKKNLEGSVVTDILIDTSGGITKMQIDRATDSIFIPSAVNALKKLRFTPAIGVFGQPVKVWWTLDIHYELNNKRIRRQ